MGNGVVVSYDEMDAAIQSLRDIAETINEKSNGMLQTLGKLEGAWEGYAQQSYMEDYNTISHSLSTTVETANSLTQSLTEYRNRIEELDQSYGGTKVG